jgi:uncharacterized protein
MLLMSDPSAARSPVPPTVTTRLALRASETRIAVVGASRNPKKYGNIIMRNLLAKGYSVLPVNPREPEIEGVEAYASVNEVPPPVHIVTFVTPPVVSSRVLDTLDPGVAEALWFQEGAFDAQVVRAAEARFPVVVHGACIMVVSNW